MAGETMQATDLRVLAVTNTWPEDGGYRGIFVHEQVNALRALGVHIDVEVIAQTRGRRDYLLAAFRVARRARGGGYHLIHIHHGLAALAARFAGPTPRVLTLYGHDVNWHWQRWCTSLGSGGIATRIFVSRRMAQAAGEPSAIVIPDGIDLDLFTPCNRTAARRKLGFAPHDTVILFGGHPGNWVKGYDVFRDVLDTLHTRGIPARELILARDGLPRHQVPQQFAAADLMLFTSREGYEGSPSVIKEACAMGLPVVSTDVGDVAEILRDVEPSAVIAFPPRGTRARHQLVTALTEHTAQTLATGHRSNGRNRVRHLSSHNIAQRILQIYLHTTTPSK